MRPSLNKLPKLQPTPAASIVARAFALVFPLLLLAACSRFKPVTHNYVYVSARQVYIRDRVAAVSNRVAIVTNGETLEVLERGKRFIKVKTPKGEIGWLEEHSVIDDQDYAQFQELTKKHANDPVIVKAQLRDDLYLHVGPGRDAQHFLLIPGNTKVDLLARGTIAKAPAPGTLPPPKPKPPVTPPATAAGAKPATPAPGVTKPAPSAVAPATDAAPPPPPAMEDWWLVRDASGHTGWLLASRLDVEIPEEVGGYGEGARFVGAYALAKVLDSGVEHKAVKKGKNGKPVPAPETEPAAPIQSEHTEYVTVLAPLKSGLPYDFDQIRVFTWSLNHHRYETGFRMRGIQGYLPLTIGQETVNGQTYPNFTFQIASGPNVSIDPDTGITRPVAPRTIVFRLEGNLIRRSGADQAPIQPMHDADHPTPQESAKAKAAKKKRR